MCLYLLSLLLSLAVLLYPTYEHQAALAALARPPHPLSWYNDRPRPLRPTHVSATRHHDHTGDARVLANFTCRVFSIVVAAILAVFRPLVLLTALAVLKKLSNSDTVPTSSSTAVLVENIHLRCSQG